MEQGSAEKKVRVTGRGKAAEKDSSWVDEWGKDWVPWKLSARVSPGLVQVTVQTRGLPWGSWMVDPKVQPMVGYSPGLLVLTKVQGSGTSMAHSKDVMLDQRLA